MTPEEILKDIHQKALATLTKKAILDENIFEKIEYVCKCTSNRACVRLLMSCLLAKLDKPHIDPRKPYSEIGGDDCFSGRTYDERYLTKFINDHHLPVNHTTAFLTPTLRNIGHALTVDRQLIGRPRDLYVKTLELLDIVATHRMSAGEIFIETVRILILLRDEKTARMESLLGALNRAAGALPLSTEAIVNLIEQHLACRNSSRLPVLIVAAAYQTASKKLQENVRPLLSHNAADLQTGSIGDVEIFLTDENSVVTAYEMKMKRVSQDDIDAAVAKLERSSTKIDNYLFITTDTIDLGVSNYAASFYEKNDGTEIAILDCIGFLRHFLHLFHRLRSDYLNTYQALVLSQPDSSVSQTLKEAFLALRQSSESGD